MPVSESRLFCTSVDSSATFNLAACVRSARFLPPYRVDGIYGLSSSKRSLLARLFLADLPTEGQQEEQFSVMYADFSEAARYLVAGLPIPASATISRASSDFRYCPFTE